MHAARDKITPLWNTIMKHHQSTQQSRHEPLQSLWRGCRELQDLLVSGGLVKDDHHARGLEDSVFRHLVAVTVHVTFVYRCCYTFYSCAPLHLCHVWQSPWLAGPNSAWFVFSQMLEVVHSWWSLYTRHTVGKLGLIALLCQASHLCGSARPVAVHLRGAGAAKRISLQRTKKDTLVQKQRGLSQAPAPGKPRH